MNMDLCAVGGTGFPNVHATVNGINVPKKQLLNGNQWESVVTSHMTTFYCHLVKMMLNSLDDMPIKNKST